MLRPRGLPVDLLLEATGLLDADLCLVPDPFLVGGENGVVVDRLHGDSENDVTDEEGGDGHGPALDLLVESDFVHIHLPQHFPDFKVESERRTDQIGGYTGVRINLYFF